MEFIHKYGNARDIEIAGFLASQFAYGRIAVLKRFLGTLFDHMGDSPYDFIARGDFSALNGMYYRFQKAADLLLLFNTLKKIVDEFGSMGNLMKAFYSKDMRTALWEIRKYLFKNSNQLTFFFPEPSPSNPLKRWNLYLRWMVRKDPIDMGLWDFIDIRSLTIPLDTHLFKIGRCLGWISGRTPSYGAARQVTEILKAISPEDPLKYDFFLCHKVGIGANCTGKRTDRCKETCSIYEIEERR